MNPLLACACVALLMPATLGAQSQYKIDQRNAEAETAKAKRLAIAAQEEAEVARDENRKLKERLDAIDREKAEAAAEQARIETERTRPRTREEQIRDIQNMAVRDAIRKAEEERAAPAPAPTPTQAQQQSAMVLDEAAFDAAVKRSVRALYAAVPEMADKRSAIRKRFDAYLAAYWEDPKTDKTVFDHSNWPVVMWNKFSAVRAQ